MGLPTVLPLFLTLVCLVAYPAQGHQATSAAALKCPFEPTQPRFPNLVGASSAVPMQQSIKTWSPQNVSLESPQVPWPPTTLHFHPQADVRRLKTGQAPLWTRRAFAGISRKRKRNRQGHPPSAPRKVVLTPLAYTDGAQCKAQAIDIAGHGYSRVTVCGGRDGSGQPRAFVAAAAAAARPRAKVYVDADGCMVHRYPMPLGGVLETRSCRQLRW